ncbi:MAG: hypothetical protein V4539_06865 [Bacteroidota bacterium]
MIATKQAQSVTFARLFVKRVEMNAACTITNIAGDVRMHARYVWNSAKKWRLSAKQADQVFKRGKERIIIAGYWFTIPFSQPMRYVIIAFQMPP